MNAEQQDIRWEQRFSSYQKALRKFIKAVNVVTDHISPDAELKDESIIEILKEGLIQRFEYTHKLAWNVMKDYAEYQGNNELSGSRDATRESFKMGLISDAEGWMDMIKSRNETSHTYNEETANNIIEKIINHYHSLFVDFNQRLEALRTGRQQILFDSEL